MRTAPGMREPLAVPCEVEAASFSGRVPPSTREAVAYVDLCGLALLDPRTLRASHRWLFTNLAGWHATSETTLSVRYIPRPNAGPRTITLLFPPGCAPEVQLDMERKVRMYAEGMIPREKLDDDRLPEGATLSADSLRDARTLPDAPLSDAVLRAAHPRRGRVDRPPSVQNTPAGWAPRRIDLDDETIDDLTIAKPSSARNLDDTFATIRAAFRGAASSAVKPASIVAKLKSTGKLHRGETGGRGGGGGGGGGGVFRTPAPNGADATPAMTERQRTVMADAVGAWRSVGTALSDTPLDEHAVRAAWERREWARQAEEASHAAAARAEEERLERLERGPEPPAVRRWDRGTSGAPPPRGHRLARRLAAEGPARRRGADRAPPPMFDATPSRGLDDSSIDGFRGAADEWPGDEGDFFYDVEVGTTPNGRAAAPGGGERRRGTESRETVDGFARDEDEEEDEEEEAAVNRRVRTFAGVVKESLARVGRAASAGDVDAEVAALINRLRRLAAER